MTLGGTRLFATALALGLTASRLTHSCAYPCLACALFFRRVAACACLGAPWATPATRARGVRPPPPPLSNPALCAPPRDPPPPAEAKPRVTAGAVPPRSR